MILMFPLFKENLLSRGSNRMITTLARWHCSCTEISDEIGPLTISPAELWSTLFVPQRMKMQDQVKFEGNFRLSIFHNRFWIFSPGIPTFNVLCFEKYSDQTSWYLLMFDIKESLVNKIFEAESFSKNFCCKFTAPWCWNTVFWYFYLRYFHLDCLTTVIYYL